MARHHNINGNIIPFTAEEETARDIEEQAWEDSGRKNSKLNTIREIRNNKIQETDYLGIDDQTMSDAIKTWRQSLRDIPQNYTTESEYDELLVKNQNGQLTHAIWSKP